MQQGLSHTIGIVVLDIAIVIVAARLMGAAFRRIGQPAVLGEITAGVLLGPTLLGVFPGNLDQLLFPTEARPFLMAIAQLGLILFMFLVGLELDLSLVRGRERIASMVSLSSVVLPFWLGFGLATVLYPRHDTVNGRQIEFLGLALFLGVAMSITAFPVLARILSDRGMHRTPVGVLSLACAAVDDVIAWSLLAIVIAVITGGSLGGVVLLILGTAAFAAFMFVVIRPLLAGLVSRHERAGRLTPNLLSVVLVGTLLSACATEFIGVHAIFGAFLFGVVMPRRGAAALIRDILEQVEHVSVLVLLPVFFVVTGLQVDVTSLGLDGLWQLGLILLAAVAGKFLGAYGAARTQRVPRRQAGALGVLMNTRGLTELVILTVGLQRGVLDSQLFSMLVVMALVTTAMTGPLLNLVYPDRLVRADIAAAQKAALDTPDAYTVLVALDDRPADRELVGLASELVGHERPAALVLSRLPPAPPTPVEVGTGRAAELADLVRAGDELRDLARGVEDRGIPCTIMSHYSADRGADLAEQAVHIDADVVVVPEGWYGDDAGGDRPSGARPSPRTRAVVRPGTTPAGPLVVVVDDDGPDAAAALRLGSHVAAQRGVPLRVQGAGGWRAGRRAAHAVEALRRGGVDVELVDGDAATAAGLLIADASTALPAARDLRGTVVAVTAGEHEVDVDGFAATLAAR
ncbi:MAG TPA: cation:proton antiporter [Pseudonocardiaceae bacterium]|nr:cation:proton antiporter [Pseudonocardiaceae bacterium]